MKYIVFGISLVLLISTSLFLQNNSQSLSSENLDTLNETLEIDEEIFKQDQDTLVNLQQEQEEKEIVCNLGYYLDEKSCIACPYGSYCPDGKNVYDCPQGTYQYYNDVYLRKSCKACGQGTYTLVPGQIECNRCPIGHSCQDPSEAPVPCSPGYYQYETNIERRYQCYKCSPGYYQDQFGQSECKICPQGYSCSNPAELPVMCEPGTYQSHNQDLRFQCYPCKTGYYQLLSGQNDCNPCPFGHYCSDPAIPPIPCEPGTYQNKDSATDRFKCQRCETGYYQDKKGQRYCKPCPQGYSCEEPSQLPVPCKAGTAQDTDEVKDRFKCYSCNQGYYQDKEGQKSCIVCPTGHSCLDPSQPPVVCLPGTVQNREKNSERYKCYTCSAGYYQDRMGQGYCLACPFGHKCKDPSKPPIPCSPGTIQSRDIVSERQWCYYCLDGYYQDKKGQSQCLECPYGHSCQDSSQPPKPCRPGLFQNQGYVSKRIYCYQCSVGEYQDEYGQRYCKNCPVGHYCPYQDMDAPLKCPSGSVSTSTGRSSCAYCSSGYKPNSDQSACIQI